MILLLVRALTTYLFFFLVLAFLLTQFEVIVMVMIYYSLTMDIISSISFMVITRLSFEVFSLESLWTLDYVLAPLPPLGIGLSVAVREGVGRGHSSALGKPMY